MTAPVAPTLAIAAVDSNVHFIVAGDIRNGDTVYLQYSLDSAFAGYSQASAPIGDSALLDFDVPQNGPRATWYFRAKTLRAGELSNASPIVSADANIGDPQERQILMAQACM